MSARLPGKNKGGFAAQSGCRKMKSARQLCVCFSATARFAVLMAAIFLISSTATFSARMGETRLSSLPFSHFPAALINFVRWIRWWSKQMSCFSQCCEGVGLCFLPFFCDLVDLSGSFVALSSAPWPSEVPSPALLRCLFTIVYPTLISLVSTQ